MAEFKLGRIRFIWKNNWSTGVTYLKDDIVRYGGKTYLCVVGHTANADFYVDLNHVPTYWNQVSDGSTWKSDWTTNTYYKINDLVKYGGRLYLCNTGHTSKSSADSNTSPDVTAGLEADQSKWDLYATSFDWKGNWTTGTRYKVDDVVRYGGISYVCNTGHHSASTANTDSDGLEADLSKWDVYAKGFDWIGNWSANYRYKKNDVVLYGGTTYVCNTGHQSAATNALGLEADQGLWDYFHKGIVFLGNWTTGTRYKVNDIVKQGSDLWICITNHTSATFLTDQSNWSLFVNGLEFENSWNNSTTYQPGDIVSYGGYAYVAVTNNVNKTPTSNLSDWNLFTTGFSFQGDWALSTSYLVGHVVRLNGYTYVSLLDHTADNVNLPPNVTYWSRLNSGVKWAATAQTFTNVSGTNVIGSGSGATFDVSLSNTKYTAVVHTGSAGTGYNTNDTVKILGSFLGGVTPANDLILTVTASGGAVQTVVSTGFSVTWASGTSYVLGDSVSMGVNSYICILAHVGSSDNRPDNDTTGTYWNLISTGSISAILTTQGDTIYYGGAGPTRLPIGTDGQVLRVTNNTPQWSYFGVVNNVVYVANSGSDISGNGQGLTIDKPWKTVRYAAKQIEDGYLNPNSAALLAKNKQFIVKELNNYVQYTFKCTVSAASTTLFTCDSTAGLYVGMPISFTGTVGGVAATTYYVFDIPNGTTFGISNTYNGSRRALSAGSGSMTGSYVYSTTSTERDSGIIVDALVYDISHSGTYQTTQAALAYFNSSGSGYVTGVYAYDVGAFVNTLNYLKVLAANVINNQPPAVNYQSSNGVLLANQAIQNIDYSLTSESNVATTISLLVSIVTTGLSAGTTSAIPAVINPGTTISVKTGTYSEILPIVVPRNTAVVGDELRSSVVQPATANTNLVNDKPKTISVLTRMKAIIPTLLTNGTVTPTSGNTTAQAYVNGFSGSTTAVSRISTNTGIIDTILAGGLGSVPAFTLTTPTGGTGNAFTAGYANAARLIYANKSFLQAEVTAYMALNYSPLWTSLGAGGQANCTRDIGYQIDALRYDLTYGGNLETVVAARSYYSNGTFVEASNEKTAALAVQTRLQAIISNIAQGIAITRTTGNVATQDVSGTGGSSAAGTQAVNRVQEVYNTINTGLTPTTIVPDTSWVSSDLLAAFNQIQATKSLIQSGAIAAINKQYPTLVYNTSTCSRDVGYIIDALCYDFMFNSNFRSAKAAMAYYRATSSAQIVINNQLSQTRYTNSYINTALQHIATGTVGDTGSTAAISSVLTNAATLTGILNNGLTSLPSFTFTNPTGYNTTFLAGYGDGKAQIVQNYAFIKAEISAWLALPANGYSAVWTALGAGGQANCQRDVGYILDALQYDMTYGGNTQTLIAGSAYFSYGTLTIASTEKAASIAAYTRLQTIVGQIVTKTAVTVTSGNAQTQVTTGTAGSAGAATFAQARVGDVISWINTSTTPTTVAPTAAIALSSTALQNGYTALQAARTEIQNDTVGWVNKFYQSMNFNSTICFRDAGYIVDALSYDLVFGTNFNSIKAGMAYYRAITSAQYVIANQLAAEIGSVNFIAQKAKRIAAYGSAAQINTTIDDVILSIAGIVTPTATATATSGNITVSSSAGLYVGMPVVASSALGGIATGYTYWVSSIVDSVTIQITSTYGSSTPITLSNASGSIILTIGGLYESCGTNTYNNVLSTINGAEILRANKAFLSNEATAWVTQSYGGTATATTASNGRVATSSAHNLTVGDPVTFTGTTFGGITVGTTYYVLTVPTTTTITLAATQGSNTPVALSDATGTMTVRYSFSSSLCQRDMGTYIDALIYDVSYLGNYKSLRAATLYKNAVNGSLLSDMFYLRNSTGVRNMTLSGLTGTLGTANSYGTKRPTAGAYTSLDPGYGPTDSNVWISTRSPYVQNVTTFGTACVGCKIDGALHVGGNRSIVSNDFTQVLSDGIGVWCTGHNALTELVSVFSYYNYAGYLAEYGGKIRATNGNNSYGTYGSLAEGVDTYETPVTATINNRYYQAQITNVVTNGTDSIYRFEFQNAGSGYNTATYSISGTGYNAIIDKPEFRDGAVYETRLTANGANYVSISNVAQGGNTTSITLAATDSAISAAYVGMRVIITSGTGVGQTGYFLTYNSGTKAGTVAKESFATINVTAAGSNLLTVASTATLYANMPIQFTGSILTGCTLALSTTYYVIGSTITSTQFSVAAGSGGTTPLSVGTSSGGGPMTVNAVGWDHIITGTSVVNNLDLTSAYIIEPRLQYASPSFSATAGTITSAAYVDMAYGDTVVTYNGSGSAGVAHTGGSGTNATFTVTRTGVSYSVTGNVAGTSYKYGDVLTIAGTLLGGTSPTNDLTITVNNVNSSTGAIQNFTYTGTGIGGYFVALVPSSTSTYISSNGTSFSSGGVLTTGATWTAVAYGAGRWVAIASGTNATNYTADPTAAWTLGGTLPQSGTWSALCYGNGVFMALQSGSTNAAYSTNGTTWFATTALPASTTWSGVAYGNGTYVAIASGGTQAASSTDGQSWTSRTLPASATWTSVTFGKGVFVAVASGSAITAYSKDGITWVQSVPGLPASSTWKKVTYGNGVFAAITSGSGSVLASSENGKDWASRTLATTQAWGAIAYGNPSSTPLWVCMGTSTTVSNYLTLGCTAQARAKVTNGAISEIRMVEPGSGYTSIPSLTITDPNTTQAATIGIRTGTGALANPNFSNRGLQYSTATATVTGNGYADMYQAGYYVNVAGLLSNPTAGSNIQIALNGNYYKLVQVSNYLGTQGNGQGGSSPYTARFQISPALTASNAPAHGTAVTMRIKYSQVRLTGHDFLSIGTGGTATTNYPNTPTQLPDVTKQTVGNGGGRVFYTATDQDGNFTVGTLFSVQQATGVASINADAFNLAGLNSLTLGSVALGGTGATITSFSTDQYFTANSDNIVPTQKAIKAYIASQIGGGSSALNVNTLTAGVIYIAGNSISTTTGVQINVSATMNFTGGINGLPVAMDFLLLG